MKQKMGRPGKKVSLIPHKIFHKWMTLPAAPLNRFAAHPREGHLKRATKIYGYLKKNPKKGYTIDPRDPILNIKYKEMTPDFGNQYSNFVEEKDPKVPDPI